MCIRDRSALHLGTGVFRPGCCFRGQLYRHPRGAPSTQNLGVVAAISAVLLLVNIHYRGWRLPAVGVGLLLITWLLAGQIYPTVVQQYRVSPNESQLESEYIDYNIESTRWAFGLDKTSVRDFPSEETLTQEQLEK